MRVLVTYGSKRGGTQDLAEAIGATLREAGHRVDVRDAREPEGLDAYDAVVVGGALYAFRWMWRVYRFLGRHRDELERMPVWFFSSGPLDHSPREKVIPPVKSVKRWMKRLDVRGHVTFGGRLAPDAKGFIASKMAKNGHAGDFRDFDEVRAWAFDLAAQLHALPDRVVRPAAASESRWGEVAAMVAGVAIVAWIVSEMALLGTATLLEVAYLVIGGATLAGAT